uniref:Signal recognition particle 9 n=1 Tax=Macaca mulatta TaxID=9544 RepID=A0A5F8A413_MACMU
MPQYQTWEEFSRAAEKLYLADPMKARVVLKYRHSDGNLCVKVTDDLVRQCLALLLRLECSGSLHPQPPGLKRSSRFSLPNSRDYSVWCIKQSKLKM